MLRFTCILVFYLQSTMKCANCVLTPGTIPFYWKTSDVTDKVSDYWNHGPVIVPGLETNVTLKSTTVRFQDMFPSLPKHPTWLPKKTTASITSKKPEDIKYSENGTNVSKTTGNVITKNITLQAILTKITTEPQTTVENTSTTTRTTAINTTNVTQILRNNIESSKITETTVTTTVKPTATTNKTTAVHLRINPIPRKKLTVIETTHTESQDYIKNDKVKESQGSQNLETINHNVTPDMLREEKGLPTSRVTTEPFTVFLTKFFKMLSLKSTGSLPMLMDQFKTYVSMLLTDGATGNLGMVINSCIAKTILMLDKIPLEFIPKYFENVNDYLENRETAVASDINDILKYADDIYDESEEEAMQAVLYELNWYPNTPNGHKLAQGFVDYVFVKPMRRVAETREGDVLINMITECLKKRFGSGEVSYRDYFKSIMLQTTKEDVGVLAYSAYNFRKFEDEVSKLSRMIKQVRNNLEDINQNDESVVRARKHMRHSNVVENTYESKTNMAQHTQEGTYNNSFQMNNLFKAINTRNKNTELLSNVKRKIKHVLNELQIFLRFLNVNTIAKKTLYSHQNENKNKWYTTSIFRDTTKAESNKVYEDGYAPKVTAHNRKFQTAISNFDKIKNSRPENNNYETIMAQIILREVKEDINALLIKLERFIKILKNGTIVPQRRNVPQQNNR